MELYLIMRAGNVIPNPLVPVNRWVNDKGPVVYGEFQQGEEREKGKQILSEGTIDLTPLDQ